MKCPKCQKKSFTTTLEFINHTDQFHGSSSLTIGNKCYERDPTDYLFHCKYPGCEQAMVHKQDFQNHIRRRHLSEKENKQQTGPSSTGNISLAVRTPRQGQLIRRQDSSPYSRTTGGERSMVSCKGNIMMAQNSSLILFLSLQLQLQRLQRVT